jgi:hypothetical protein
MTVRIDESLEGIDWAQAKADLALGYRYQPVFMSAIVGEWLGNEANQA